MHGACRVWEVGESKVSWDDNTCKLIHKRSHLESYYSDKIYHMTWSLVFSIGVFYGMEYK